MSNVPLRCPHCGFIAWRYAPAALAAYQKLLVFDGPLTTAALAAFVGCSVQTAKNHVRTFQKAGILRRVGTQKRGPNVGGVEAVYQLTRRGALHPMTDARDAVPGGNCGPRRRAA